MKRLLPLIFIVITCSAQADGDDWLTRASNAVRTTNYSGVLVYLRDGKMDTLRIVHRYKDGNERERLISLSGEPREIIRDNGMVTCVLPNQQVVLVARHAMQSLLSNVADLVSSGLKNNYEVKNIGSERLADRMCHVVAVQPKDQFRYGYRLLIDQKTNLPLKLELIRNKKVLEQMMFTDIDFPKNITDAALKPTFDTHKFRWIRHQEVKTADAPKAVKGEWHATQLPAGFRMAESGWRRVSGGSLARQLLFTDGIATVSAFIAQASDHPFIGSTTMGAVNAYGRETDKHQITVVGEVPDATVKFIAEHIKRRPVSAAAKP